MARATPCGQSVPILGRVAFRAGFLAVTGRDLRRAYATSLIRPDRDAKRPFQSDSRATPTNICVR